ncbi:hypothetical protein AC578_7368 [Pseudocercospora eumusae]|uniref:Histone-lysine N-methyltransferase, H3 lysine-79 specific n=1 Tax=Pseudocercospora eumusae TaxID=321146 RepID=A0A139H522_9PEZI|nr:hypothetical protein AC578_7368 [Pseudocercospora eumusae]
MNFGSKPKTTNTGPVIRKTTVKIPIPQAAKPQTNGSTTAKAPVRPYNPDRFKPSNAPISKKPPNPAKRAVSAARGVKRKSVTPQPAWSSDEDDASSDVGGSDSDASRKRIKSSVSSIESSGPRRPLLSEKAFAQHTVFDIIHGADATSGEYTSKFKNPWADDAFKTCELQYPSRGQRERFQLKWPKNEADDYKPMEDIIETIHTICDSYLPDDLATQYTSEETGFRRRFNLAWKRQDVEEFIAVVDDFNTMLRKLVNDGTVQTVLRSKSHVSLDWARRVLEQIYSRTVSPKVETLRRYENGSDDVYGELLPRFASDIFKKTKLNHDMTFLDLGSGVGNVVLQAALEIGCDSWGIEKMPNPCDLAELQEKEFPERAKLWGLDVGKARCIRGDFTNNKEVGEVLKRADVVLVNNQAFTPALNDALLHMFLDLKEGCQVVSLKPFVPEGHKMSTRNYSSMVNHFVQQKYEYFSDSVSWGADWGNWYIARKDREPLRRFMKLNGLR